MSRPTEASLSAGRAASQIAERVAHACARYSLPPLTRLLRLPFVPYSLPVCCCSRVHNGHAHLPSMRVYTSSQNSISSSRSLLFAPILSSPDHFTHVLPVDCAVYFFFILPSVSFFFFFFFLVIDREPRTQSRTPSRSNRDFTIRSERWKAVTGRPFRPPIHFRVAIQRYWSGRIERGPARVYIYTCTHRTKSGRETRERTRGR